MGEGGVHAMHTLPARYYEIRSMSGRCASYWNAFLFSLFWFFFVFNNVINLVINKFKISFRQKHDI